MSGSPEELLRSALEKIVFFECKVSSLESELEAARSVATRAREDAGGTRRRETELEQALSQLRGEHAASSGQNAELQERVRLLEAERERFLSGMVESARLAGAPADEDGEATSAHDLAGFIAELRAEIEQLRTWKRAAEAAGIRFEGDALVPGPAPTSGPAAPLPALATRFEASGRIGVSEEAVRSLPSFSTRSERVLYESSLDDLESADPSVRRRAADGLRSLGSKSAAPLVAAVLGREREAEVKVSLLAALGALGEPGAAELALRELSDPHPSVRAAALESASALAHDAVAPRLASALSDANALVRRRAVVLLGFIPGDLADDALIAAITDRDAGVARAAAVALAGRPSPRAQRALARALDHREPAVRRAAAKAVGRWSGEEIDVSAPEPERRRMARRITEKLLEVDGAALRSAVMRVPAEARRAGARPIPAPIRAEARPPPPPVVAPPPRGGVRRAESEAAVSTVRPAVKKEPAAAVVAPDQALVAAALAEVRTALRGRTVEEIAAVLPDDRGAIEASLRALVAQGRLVTRGPRFFMS